MDVGSVNNTRWVMTLREHRCYCELVGDEVEVIVSTKGFVAVMSGDLQMLRRLSARMRRSQIPSASLWPYFVGRPIEHILVSESAPFSRHENEDASADRLIVGMA
jgi:hypothetical protein